jgi:hypothetical protein
VRIGGNVGWALGPMVAGFVAASVGSGAIYRTLFLGTSALTVMVMLVLAFAVEESLPTPKGATPAGLPRGKGVLRVALTDCQFLALLAAAVLLYYVFTQDWQALPVYAKNFVGVPDGRIGQFLGANGVIVIDRCRLVRGLLHRATRDGVLLWHPPRLRRVLHPGGDGS